MSFVNFQQSQSVQNILIFPQIIRQIRYSPHASYKIERMIFPRHQDTHTDSQINLQLLQFAVDRSCEFVLRRRFMHGPNYIFSSIFFFFSKTIGIKQPKVSTIESFPHKLPFIVVKMYYKIDR